MAFIIGRLGAAFGRMGGFKSGAVEPPEPGTAPTANFSIAANSQLVAVLMGDF